MNNYRSIALYGILAAAVLYFGGDWAYSKFWKAPQTDLNNRKTGYEAGIKKWKATAANTRDKAAWLAMWERRSLPSDLDVARSLYQAWLVELTRYAGLANPSFNPLQPVNSGKYRSIAFSVRARGSLEQLTTFLFEFYNANHLHQIQSLTITPIARSELLDLSISIQVLALPRADRLDQLPTVVVDRSGSPGLDDYRPIVERNLFAVGDPGADPTDHVYLTGVSYVDGVPEAWFTLRTDGTTLKLRQGDQLVQTGRKIRKLCEVDDLKTIQFEGLRSRIETVGEIHQGVLVRCNGQVKLVAFAHPDSSDPKLRLKLKLQAFKDMVTPVGRLVEMEGTDLVLRTEDGEWWLISVGESLAQAYALPLEF